MNTRFTAFYTYDGRNTATLRIAGDNEASLDVTAIVARLETAHVSHFKGNEASEKLYIADTDRVIILVDRLGQLEAHGVYEVCTALVEQGYLLMPRGGSNLLLDQNEQLRDEDLDNIKKLVEARR